MRLYTGCTIDDGLYVITTIVFLCCEYYSSLRTLLQLLNIGRLLLAHCASSLAVTQRRARTEGGTLPLISHPSTHSHHPLVPLLSSFSSLITDALL